MNPANTTVVVSCYKKSTEWASRLQEKGFNILRYTKEDSTSIYNVEKNIGNEASTYLKYIIDFYESLPEYTIFLHDEEFSWHHEGSINNRIEESIGFDGQYISLNTHTLSYFYLNYNKTFVCFYEKYIKKYIGNLAQFGEFIGPKRKGAAQMIVSRSAILANPYEMYVGLYSWMMSMSEHDKIMRFQTGIYMENLWGLIFGDVKPLATTSPRIAHIGTKNGVAYYANQFIDFEPNMDVSYDLYLYKHESIKNINYDFFYTQLLELFPYKVPGFTLMFKNDMRFILTNIRNCDFNIDVSSDTLVILPECIEESTLLGYGFEEQIQAASY